MPAPPISAIASATGNVVPAQTPLQGLGVDPSQIYVAVRVPGAFLRPDPSNGANGAYAVETYYRFSDLVNYIVAVAQGR